MFKTLRSNADYSEVKRVGVDEPSARKGLDCIALFFDMDERLVLNAITIK